MILITGSTGFVGRRLVHRLTAEGRLQVRVLLRPGSTSQHLPRGVPVYAMMGSLNDGDSLLAAMDGVHTVFHLIGTETRGRYAQLADVDVGAARAVIEAAQTARVGRIIYVSRLGADRASAHAVQRAKGQIEDLIIKSGLAYTIFRTSVLFGHGDRFSEHIAMLAKGFPLYFVPGDGEMVLQPLWVDDLVTCLAMSLEDLNMIDATIKLGGPELLSYRRIVMRVMRAVEISRPIVGAPLLVHRAGAWFLDGLFARWPFTTQWVEMLSTNQTAEIGEIEREFGFRPAAFDIGLLMQYMARRRYSLELLRYIFTTRW